MILCASELRSRWGQGVDLLVRLAADAGFAGFSVGASCAQRDLSRLVTEGAAAGLAVPLAAAPLPEAALPAGRRLPHLSAVEDEDERLAAVKLVAATWTAASPLGVTVFSLDLGAVELHSPPDIVAYHFARRELDDDEPGDRLWGALLAERRARSASIVDACRYALDRLLPRAEQSSLRLAIEVTGPWGAPTPREAAILLDEYRGAPLSIVWDEARSQVFSEVGLGLGADRRSRLLESTGVLRCHEAVGIETGFAPGLGDQDGTGEWVNPSSSPPPLVLVSGRPDTTLVELTRARELVEARLARPSPPP